MLKATGLLCAMGDPRTWEVLNLSTLYRNLYTREDMDAVRMLTLEEVGVLEGTVD